MSVRPESAGVRWSLAESGGVWRIVWWTLADSPPESGGLRPDYVGQ